MCKNKSQFLYRTKSLNMAEVVLTQSTKKVRNPNFTQADCLLLCEIMGKPSPVAEHMSNHEVYRAKSTPGITPNTKKQLWNDIAELFNKRACQPRSPADITKKWDNLVQTHRIKFSDYEKECRKGTTSGKLVELLPVTAAVMDVIEGRSSDIVVVKTDDTDPDSEVVVKSEDSESDSNMPQASRNASSSSSSAMTIEDLIAKLSQRQGSGSNHAVCLDNTTEETTPHQPSTARVPPHTTSGVNQPVSIAPTYRHYQPIAPTPIYQHCQSSTSVPHTALIAVNQPITPGPSYKHCQCNLCVEILTLKKRKLELEVAILEKKSKTLESILNTSL